MNRRHFMMGAASIAASTMLPGPVFAQGVDQVVLDDIPTYTLSFFTRGADYADIFKHTAGLGAVVSDYANGWKRVTLTLLSGETFQALDEARDVMHAIQGEIAQAQVEWNPNIPLGPRLALEVS